MSDLIVRVVRIDEVRPHPNADKLEIVKVGGWQIVSGKGNYQAGQLAVHVPPDAMVPLNWAYAWGVSEYLVWKKDARTDIGQLKDDAKGRVKAVKLRGAPSFGFLAPMPDEIDAPVGSDLAAHYGIEKYEEPVPIGMQAGQMARNHPLFHAYTDIQNLRNYPHALNYDNPLFVTEKLHGTNSRVGWVATPDPENGGMSHYFEKMAGSHHTQRKIEDAGVYGLPWELHGEALNGLFDRVMKDMQIDSLIIFGEIYGPGVQDLTYGQNEKSWRIFDIAVNGTYLPWAYVREICAELDLPTVPHLGIGFYTFEELCALAEGPSILSPGQIKEGIVVRPLAEETWVRGELDPHPKRRIFKVISPDYLTRKGGTEYH